MDTALAAAVSQLHGGAEDQVTRRARPGDGPDRAPTTMAELEQDKGRQQRGIRLTVTALSVVAMLSYLWLWCRR